MPFIHLTTFIAAPRERVFDLSRSVDLHRSSMSHYGEKAVGGVMSGLVKEGDTITWQARHLNKERQLEIKITGYSKPDFFIDEQVKGDFVLFKHEHYFKEIENGTIMIDQLRFESPYGFWGRLVNRFYLEKYITRLLEQRNAAIKKASEGNQWKQFLSQ
ncbi:MAG TPA: SRPBCC family protein [Flavisolibacter sp.]|nr:SRPBCC family protein [Flavisolibacter sp.]